MINDLVDKGITDIFQLGDLFDRRKYINFKTLNESKRCFFDKLKANNIHLHVLVGNHDIHMRESVDINSPSLVLGEYDNVSVYTKPTTVNYHGTTIDMIPWICRDNEKEVFDFITKSKSDLCFGHFEIMSFVMYQGMESHEGLPMDTFAKYELVCSGHYHTRSRKDNIVYVGTPYEMTWQDYNDPKGYHLFDIETRELEFVGGGDTVFTRIEYNDTQPLVDLNTLELRDKFVKLIVTNKTDLYKFDNYVQKLYSKGCYEIKIVEDLTEFTEGEINEDLDLEDTIDVVSNYIDSIETTADKEKIKAFMKGLYVEAINYSTDDT
jgi:DNA repair exonuclease SbcCD nuclease subunit